MSKKKVKKLNHTTVWIDECTNITDDQWNYLSQKSDQSVDYFVTKIDGGVKIEIPSVNLEFSKTLNELKNKNTMEITEHTKIKDLIPEGYELETKILKDVNLGIFGEYINIPVKKKEVKDFKWYIKNYLNKKYWLHMDNELIVGNFEGCNFDGIPFEFKIGLLKFICDDLGANVEAFIIAKSFGGGGSYAKVEGICPPEFLNSIFK